MNLEKQHVRAVRSNINLYGKPTILTIVEKGVYNRETRTVEDIEMPYLVKAFQTGIRDSEKDNPHLIGKQASTFLMSPHNNKRGFQGEEWWNASGVDSLDSGNHFVTVLKDYPPTGSISDWKQYILDQPASNKEIYTIKIVRKKWSGNSVVLYRVSGVKG